MLLATDSAVSWKLLDPELLVLLVTLVATVLLVTRWLERSRFGARLPKSPPSPALNEAQRAEVVGWERDRILAAAKGLATTSAGFLVTIVTMLLKKEIMVVISGWTVLGLILGPIGVLGLAAILANKSRTFVEENLQ